MDSKNGGDVAGSWRECGEIGRGEPGVPVVSVEEIRSPVLVGAACDFRGDPAKQPEAAMVVGPIASVRACIGAAGPIVVCRLVDEVGEAFRPGQPGKTYPHAFRGEGRVQPGDIGDPGKSIEKARKAWQQQTRIDAERGQRRW